MDRKNAQYLGKAIEYCDFCMVTLSPDDPDPELRPAVATWQTRDLHRAVASMVLPYPRELSVCDECHTALPDEDMGEWERIGEGVNARWAAPFMTDRKTAQDRFFWDPEHPTPVEYRGHRIAFDHLEGRFGAVYWDRIGEFAGSSGCEEVEGPEFDRIAAFCSALDSIDEYHDSRGEELVVCDRCAGEGYLLLWGTHRPDVKCGGCDGMGRVPERNAHVAPELRRYLNAITSRVRPREGE